MDVPGSFWPPPSTASMDEEKLNFKVEIHENEIEGQLPQISGDVHNESFQPSTSGSQTVSISSQDQVSQKENNEGSIDEMFQCPECEKLFSTLDELKLHFKKSHKLTFKKLSASTLDKYLNKPLKARCPVCDKRLANAELLNEHFEGKHQGSLLQCPQCSRGFTQQSALTHHLNKVHNVVYQAPPPKNTLASQPKTSTPTKEDIVTYPRWNEEEYESATTLEDHEAATSSRRNEHNWIPEDIKIALSDTAVYGPEKRYTVGIKTKEDEAVEKEKKAKKKKEPKNTDVLCPICGKIYKDKKSMSLHLNGVHLGVRFYCDLCTENFSQKSSLRRHIQSFHKNGGDNKIHLCNACGQKFSRKLSLKLHVENVHLKTKKFECEFCGATFNMKHHLNNHRDSKHYGVKHNCDRCGKIFSDKNTMYKHGKECRSENKLKCEECPAEFKIKFHYLNHLKKTHGIIQ